MKEIEKSVYDKAILDLCKQAHVKWPLQLVGKKIAFVINDGDAEVKIYETINRVLIANENGGGGTAIIGLNNGQYPQGRSFIMKYNSDKNRWEHCQVKGEQSPSPIKCIVFETKFWQF